MRIGRSKTAGPPGPDPFSGGFDEELWQRVVGVVIAAHVGDPRGYSVELKRSVDGLELGRLRLLSLYTTLLIRYRMGTMLGRAPVAEDVIDISNRVRARFFELIPVNAGLLEETVRTALRLAPPAEEVQGGTFQIRGIVILALLLDDPMAWLAAMKPRLISYCALHAESIQRVCLAPPGP
jgi:hypothetical protein